MAIGTVKLSKKAKDKLIRLKRWTGLQHWNELCRWAFCLSLAEPSIPPTTKVSSDGGIEMDWRTFGGKYHEVYLALLKQRCHKDGLGTDEAALAQQLRLHLHRGIGYLASDRKMRSIADFVRKAPLEALAGDA